MPSEKSKADTSRARVRPVHCAFHWLLASCLFALTLSSCGGTRDVEEPTAGKRLTFRPGSPDFDLEVVPFWGNGGSGVDLYLVLARTSLAFMRERQLFVAQYEMTAVFRDARTGDLVQDEAWAETLVVASYEETQLASAVAPTKRVKCPPGTFDVEVILRDRNSEAQVRRSRRVRVFEPNRKTPALGRILLERQQGRAEYQPQFGFQLPATDDMLRVAASIHRIPEGDTASVALLVIRFNTDSTVASPPYAFGRMGLSESQQLVSLNRVDTVVARSVRVSGRGDERLFHYYLPRLGEGLFRLLLRVNTPITGGSDTLLEQSKYVLILSPGFPRPSTYRELLRATEYIARRDELKGIRTAADEDSLRHLFESFWLELCGGDALAARNLIRRYYSRTEEANKYFTTYKEGWKTDRGMVYTVLGPPPLVDRLYDNETWYYDYGGSNSANRYQFRRVYVGDGELSLEDYVLIRSPGYERLWDEIVSRWRRGVVF